MKFKIILIIIALNFFLTSCQQSNKKQSKRLDWKSVKTWSAKGKISIQSEFEKGSGRFQYTKNRSNVKAKFSAPLGQGSWSLEETPNLSTITSSKNGISTHSSTEALLTQELGWEFPWKPLSSWLRGFKSNQIESIHKNSIDEIQEHQWTISYEKWSITEIGLLPKKITAEFQKYKLKIIIYSWEFE